MNVNCALSLILALFISASLSGCLLHDMGDTKRLDSLDVQLNPWLGKTKDFRMKIIGPPDKCAALSAGGEVCEWVLSGVSAVHCPPDAAYSGHQCSGGGSWEDHFVFTYDQDGIATEWNYNGSLGQRSSRVFQTRQAMKSIGLGGVPHTTTGNLEEASSVRPSPREIVLVGFPLEPEASRQQIQDAILRRGGKLLSHQHSPERDEFDSSRWITGSEKTAAVYTQTGQFVGLAISWPMEDSHGGRAFATQLQAKLVKDFGPATRDDIGQGGWPAFYQWETSPISVTIIGEGKHSPSVSAMFMLPDRLTVFNSELDSRRVAR